MRVAYISQPAMKRTRLMIKLLLGIMAGCVAMMLLMAYLNSISYKTTVRFLKQKLPRLRWEQRDRMIQHFTQPVKQVHTIFSSQPPFSGVNESADTHVVTDIPMKDSYTIQNDTPADAPTAGGRSDNGKYLKENAVQIRQPLDISQRYLFTSFIGRLGNVMFKFASAFCIAMKNNLTIAVRSVGDIEKFQYNGIKLDREAYTKMTAATQFQTLGGGRCHDFKVEYLHLEPGNTSYKLAGYFQSWKYFEPCKKELIQAISFKETIVIKALGVIRKLREEFPGKVLVGVHVRMEDFLLSRALDNGKTVAPPSYYIRAMTYIREKIPGDVRFMVITSDSTWFKRSVTNDSDVTLLNRSDSAAVDMEVLSRMDHLIMSVGTFGWWAGYKNKGTVVCYKDFFVPNTHFGRQFRKGTGNFIYPGWIQL